MRKNLGKWDKVIRVSVALAIAVLYFTHVISGITAFVLGLLAIVFMVTAFISFCPLYLPFGISTLKKRRKP